MGECVCVCVCRSSGRPGWGVEGVNGGGARFYRILAQTRTRSCDHEHGRYTRRSRSAAAEEKKRPEISNVKETLGATD